MKKIIPLKLEMTEIMEAASRDEEEVTANNQFNFIRSKSPIPPMPATFYVQVRKVNNFLPKRDGNDNPWNRKPDLNPRKPITSSITQNTNTLTPV